MDRKRAAIRSLAALASVTLLAASPEHASRQDLDHCRQTASGQAEAAPMADKGPNEIDPAEVEKIDACMRAKGYVRVQDTAGLCDLAVVLQCFERSK